MIDRKELKTQAREAIRATRPSPVLVTLTVLLILAVTQVLSLSLSGDLAAYRAMAEAAMQGRFVFVEPSASSGAMPWLLTLALDLMTMVISVGYTLYCLRVSRRRSPSFGDVFDAFAFFLRAIWLCILRSVVISLLSFAYALPAAVLCTVMDPVLAVTVCLPLFIPMIIAAYAYGLSVLILLDNPTYSAIQCMALSRMAMKGRKKELFLLELSFIGWLLLCLIPPVILWVRPYMNVTVCGWYDRVMPGFLEELKNRPAPVRTAPGPVDWHVPGESRSDDEDNNDDEKGEGA